MARKKKNPSAPSLVETAKKKRHLFLLEKLKEKSLDRREIDELDRLEKGETQLMDWRNLNQQTVMKVLDTNAHRLNKWLARGCPCSVVDGRKTYDCGKILEWRVAREREAAGVDGDLGGEDGATTDALEEYRRVKAETARFDLEVKQGRYVEKEKHEQVLDAVGDYVRKEMQELGKRVAIQVAKASTPEDCEKVIADAVVESLMRMHAMAERM